MRSFDRQRLPGPTDRKGTPLIDLSGLAAHQASAAARLAAILSVFPGAILADEVGMGKSWIAAAMAREEIRRGRAVEILAPASLLEMWTGVLEQFEISARILSHESLFRRAWATGMHGEGLVIVDEAHRFRNPGTKRYDALAARTVGRRVLLVTATPFCNSSRDLASLLRLIVPDDGFRAFGIASVDQMIEENVDSLRRILAMVMIRRSRDSLPRSLALPRLARQVIRFPLTANGESCWKWIGKLSFPGIGGIDPKLLRRFYHHRLLSSPAALADSVRRQRRFYRRVLALGREGLDLGKRAYRRLFGDVDEDVEFQDMLFPGAWLSAPQTGSSVERIQRELDLLDGLLRELESVSDEKLRLLLQSLEDEFEPTLVFAGSIVTASALHEACRVLWNCGLITSRILKFDRRRIRSRADLFAAFSAGALDLLVLTDLGAEGLNLQRAGRVVHYDLPWNRVRLDQRNGRACRIGQRREEIRSLIFIPEERDGRRVLAAVARKGREARRFLPAPEAAPELSVPFPGAAHPRPESHGGCLHPRSEQCSEDLVVLEGSCFMLGLTVSDGQPIWSLPVPDDLPPAGASGLDSCAPAREAMGRVTSRLATRSILPSMLPEGSPQISLARRFEGIGLLDGDLEELLGRRYRAGVERLLGTMSGEYLDRSRAEYVRGILRRERSLDGAPIEGKARFAVLFG